MPFARWPVPSNGEGSSLPPDERVAAGCADRIDNFLTYRDGILIPRGRIGAAGAGGGDVWATRTDQSPVCAHLTWGSTMMVMFRDVSSGLVDVSRVPINRPTTAGQLSQFASGAAAAVSIDMVTGAQTPLAFVDSSRGIGPRSARLNDLLYTPSFGGASTAIPSGVGQRNFLNLASTTLGLKLLAGPSMIQDVIAHMGRLWVAAAIPAGGGAVDYDTSLVHVTRPNGAGGLADNAATWQNSDGVYNRLTFGPANDGDFVVGFGRAGGHLVVFKRNSVWVVYGTSLEDVTVRQVRSSAGCVDVRSIVTADSDVLFASQLGYERFNGERFEVLSAPISEDWLAHSSATVASSAVTTGYIRAGAVGNEYVMVALGTDPVVLGAAVPNVARCYLLHAPSGAWSRLSSGAPMRLGAGGGFMASSQPADMTVLWGNGTYARADRVAFGNQDLFDEWQGSAVSVPLTLRASMISPGGWYDTAQLLRLGLDYRHEWAAAPPSPTPPGAMSLYTSAFDPYGTPYAVPDAHGRPRRRAVFDSHFELPEGDVGFTLTSTLGADPALRIRGLHVLGAWVEYKTGRPRRL